ncbi:hypothetical protein M569_01720 [Genlisea aurea]|uniref:LysM domain-containing protein n=1 Tax=Genlisea aurea TaxID=192259 RepID=S8EAW7_9LAMI|nr:hypothetical protein M569_01720 [Genlisea aurea]
MGCCGDGDGDDATENDSDFTALSCRDTLREILARLPVVDLARSACVCRLWRSVASDREMRNRAFTSPWKIRDVVGTPTSANFWRDNSLSKFALSHRLRRGDSIASLALRYSVQVIDIKRLNNMMSDHGIHSRDRLLIPIGKPETLIDSTCFIEMDSCANREVAVLYPPHDDAAIKDHTSRVAATGGMKRSMMIMAQSVRRGMNNADLATARYYLSLSDGDPRAAVATFSEDLNLLVTDPTPPFPMILPSISVT